jgi:gp49
VADGKISITLKGGKGYDAPWIVVSGDTVAEVERSMLELGESRLIELTKLGSEALVGAVGVGGAAQGGGTPVEADRPAGVGADWTLREGTGKNGKPWKGWFPPRGSTEKPVWV